MLPIKHFVIGCNADSEYSMIYTPRIQSIFPELPCVGLSYLFRIQLKSLNQNDFIFVNLIFYHIDLILVILTSHHLLIWSDFDFWLWIETVTSWKNMSKNFNLLQKYFDISYQNMQFSSALSEVTKFSYPAWRKYTASNHSSEVLKVNSEKRKMARRPVSILCS